MANRVQARGKSSILMPRPLSATVKFRISTNLTEITVAPASREFSTNSLTIYTMDITTSPAAMLLIVSGSNYFICAIFTKISRMIKHNVIT